MLLVQRVLNKRCYETRFLAQLGNTFPRQRIRKQQQKNGVFYVVRAEKL
jgi:hypothetical protein